MVCEEEFSREYFSSISQNKCKNNNNEKEKKKVNEFLTLSTYNDFCVFFISLFNTTTSVIRHDSE